MLMRRILFPLLLVATAITPTVALAKGSRVPSCAAVSRSEIAKLAQTGVLTLKKRTGNLCEFTGEGEHRGHYKPTLEIQIVPYFNSIWDSAKSQAMKSGSKDGNEFGEVSRSLFFVTGKETGKGLQPCKKDLGTPGRGDSKFGPACETEPDASHIGAYGNGIDKRNHLHLMVSVGVTGQLGDVHLSHMIKLAKDVISGKIH